jgi:hypothetical protein
MIINKKMKRYKFLLIFLTINFSCVFPTQQETVMRIDTKFKSQLVDYQKAEFISNKQNSKLLTVFVVFGENHQHGNIYHEECRIYYSRNGEYVSYLYNPENMFSVGQDYSDIVLFTNTAKPASLGVKSYAESENISKTISYQQSGHVYPDVYVFEMDTVLEMADWDTTMNLFPDVRKVWYSLSQGIVRYDMNDGESYKLVE